MQTVRATRITLLSFLLLAGGSATAVEAKCKGDCADAAKLCSEVSAITTTRTPTRFEIEVDWCDEEATTGKCSTLTQTSEGALAGIASCFHAGTFKERIVERMPIRVRVENFNHFAYQLDIDATEEENEAYTKLLGWWQALGLDTITGLLSGAGELDRRGCSTFDEVLSSWTAQTARIARRISPLIEAAGTNVALTASQRGAIGTRAEELRRALAGEALDREECNPNAPVAHPDWIETRRGDWGFKVEGLSQVPATPRLELKLTIECTAGNTNRRFVDLIRPYSAADRARAAGVAATELAGCDRADVDTPTLSGFVAGHLTELLPELDTALDEWAQLRSRPDPCCPTDPAELRKLALEMIRTPEEWDRFDAMDARFEKVTRLGRALLTRAQRVDKGLLTDHRVLGLKLAAGTMVTVNFQASPLEDAPGASFLPAAPNQGFSPFDVQFFVESKQPVVFHLGLAARTVDDLSVDQVLDVGESNAIILEEDDYAGSLTAFLSLRLKTFGKRSDFAWLASLGTDSTKPGENIYVSPLTLNWRKIFLTVGMTSVEALKVDGELGDPNLETLRSARDWEPFIAVTFDALGRWRR